MTLINRFSAPCAPSIKFSGQDPHAEAKRKIREAGQRAGSKCQADDVQAAEAAIIKGEWGIDYTCCMGTIYYQGKPVNYMDPRSDRPYYDL